MVFSFQQLFLHLHSSEVSRVYFSNRLILSAAQILGGYLRRIIMNGPRAEQRVSVARSVSITLSADIQASQQDPSALRGADWDACLEMETIRMI